MKALECYLKSEQDLNESETRNLYHLLRSLSTLRSPPHLDELRNAAGSSLERSLAALTCKWIKDYHPQRIQIEDTIAILLRIGGQGFTFVTNNMLMSHEKAVRRDGLDLALVQPDATTIETINSIAISHEVDDGRIPHISILHDKAERLLSQLGEDASSVEIALLREIDVFRTSESRKSQEPMAEEAIRPAIEALASDDDENLKYFICLAIGVSGCQELIPTLQRVVQDSNAETRVAKGALFGLAGLCADDQTSIKIFASHLRLADHRFVAANGLLRTNKPEARQELVEELSGYSAENPFSFDERILFALAQYSDTRESAVEILRASIMATNDAPNMFRSPEYLKFFGDCVDVETEETLRAEADPPEIGTHVTGRRAAAIRGLAKRDSGAAFEAAERALSNSKNERDVYPDLLIELDAKRAVPILCNRFRRERNRLVRRAIGLALRIAGLDDQVLKYAASWLLDGDANARCRAAQL